MEIHKEYCKSCKRPIKGDECSECHDIWKDYIPPVHCMYCNEIGTDFCFPCKSGEGQAHILASPWRSTEAQIRADQRKAYLASSIRRVWQIATLLGKSKKFGLEKREYLMRKYTWYCTCRSCKKLRKSMKGWNAKGMKKRKQWLVYEDKMWWKNPTLS